MEFVSCLQEIFLRSVVLASGKKQNKRDFQTFAVQFECVVGDPREREKKPHNDSKQSCVSVSSCMRKRAESECIS